MKNILLVCAFFLSFLITFDLFLKEPPVWPDEAGLVNFSLNPDTNLVNYYRSYPSVYIVLLSEWFKIYGVSITSQRILSLIAGILTILVFYFISKNFNLKYGFLKIFGLILLLTDFTFLQSTRVGRPEIWTLFFGMMSIYFLQSFVKSEYKKPIFLFISIILSIIALAFHINGFIFLFTISIVAILSLKKILKYNKKILLLFSLLLSPIFIWFGSRLILTIGTFILRWKISDAQNSWLYTVFSVKPIELKLIYLVLIIISVLFFLYVVFKKKLNLIIIAIPLILSWVILILNKDFWYAVYLIPFTYLSLLILLDVFYMKLQETKSIYIKYKFLVLIILCLVIFLANLKFHINILLSEGGDRYSYQQYISNIKEVIPDEVSVFTSAIPDPYYAFVNRKNTLTRFPQSFVEKGGYLKELNETDYIIYNGPYGSNYYGNIVMEYLEKNKLEIIQIGSPGQYQAIIAKLKPRNQRINP